MPRRSTLPLTLLTALLLLSPTAGRAADEDWNDAKVKWMSYDEGLAAAKKAKKPVCLIFYTEWCPHCKNFSHVFQDDGVATTAKSFVMIRIDKDKQPEISKKYAPDGEYIPRTYFLASDGTLDPDIHAPRPNFKYFYDERAPQSVLAGMREALAKHK